MAKMAHARKDHRQTETIGGRDDLLVFYASSRLYDRGDTMRGSKFDTVWKWEKCVRG